MKRPSFADFFPAHTSPEYMQKVFTANPELYQYITALDGYVDHVLQTVESLHEIIISEKRNNESNRVKVYELLTKFNACPNCLTGTLEEINHKICKDCHWESI